MRIIIDPIDGTRGLMYDKRSAFFLAGAAPNRGDSTTLQDIEVAAMVELPTTRSRGHRQASHGCTAQPVPHRQQSGSWSAASVSGSVSGVRSSATVESFLS